MLSNLRIGAKLVSGFLIVSALGGLLGGMGVRQIRHLTEHSEAMSEHVIYPMGVVSKFSSKFQEAKGLLGEIVYTTDPQQQQRLFTDFDKLRGEVNALKEAFERTLTTDEERKETSDFKSAQKFTDESIKTMMELLQAGNRGAAIALFTGDVKNGAGLMAAAMDKLVANKNAKLKMALAENAKTATTAQIKIILFLIGSVITSIGIGLWIARSITSPMNEAVAATKRIAAGDLTVRVAGNSGSETGQLLAAIADMVENLRHKVTRTVDISTGIATASKQLTATSQQIAASAEQVAVQSDTMASACQEMSSTSSDIARNCTIVAAASSHSIDAAKAGEAVVHETINGMNVIADRVRQTSATIEALGQRSEDIGNIIGTIEDIADQTNLLALNAAIEAARAGEQGRGFAVVADEVRALAERTTNATREIGDMIKSIQAETRQAVKAMEEGVHEVERGALSSQKSGQALEKILSQISEVSLQTSQIATAAEQQNATTSEVTNNVQKITDVVSDTARGAEQTAVAAAQLAEQSQELRVLVSDFRLA